MSVRISLRLIWLVAVFVLPVPFFLVETGRVPVGQLLQMSAVVLGLILAEGTQGQILTLLIIVLGQAILYMVAFWGAAVLWGRLVARMSPRARLVATSLVVLVVIAVASSVEIYRTPFSTRSLRASLLRVYE
jgi:hypothetical protein